MIYISESSILNSSWRFEKFDSLKTVLNVDALTCLNVVDEIVGELRRSMLELLLLPHPGPRSSGTSSPPPWSTWTGSRLKTTSLVRRTRQGDMITFNMIYRQRKDVVIRSPWLWLSRSCCWRNPCIKLLMRSFENELNICDSNFAIVYNVYSCDNEVLWSWVSVSGVPWPLTPRDQDKEVLVSPP